MPGPDCFRFLVVPPAYAGPSTGLELIPYFLALLAWAGVALSAVLLWPIAALLRRLRRAKDVSKEELTKEPVTANVPESPGESSHDKL